VPLLPDRFASSVVVDVYETVRDRNPVRVNPSVSSAAEALDVVCDLAMVAETLAAAPPVVLGFGDVAVCCDELFPIRPDGWLDAYAVFATAARARPIRSSIADLAGETPAEQHRRVSHPHRRITARLDEWSTSFSDAELGFAAELVTTEVIVDGVDDDGGFGARWDAALRSAALLLR
jgi:hypothetical protein